jgi:hypothetical protein
VQRAEKSSIAWKNVSIAEICSAKMITQIIWLGRDATRAWLRKREGSGESEGELPHDVGTKAPTDYFPDLAVGERPGLDHVPSPSCLKIRQDQTPDGT